jgi:stage II sporulation protein D
MTQGPFVPVLLSKSDQVVQVPIETYVRGVVAAEMPAAFELEAMKAQAMAARTYVVRRLLDPSAAAKPGSDAVVTDTVTHQAYWTVEEMQLQWGEASYSSNLEKVTRAVKETAGKILTYEGKPIDAAFFSTSNGYTENSEDYWGVAVPYLRSVASPWDKSLSPRFTKTVTITAQQFTAKLGLNRSLTATTLSSGMKTLSTTTGHRVAKIRIGGVTFTGREVREKLGLDSTAFTWRWKDGSIELTTTGYGHGVGMSQWGANGMAKEGKTADQIVSYYYKGISIEDESRYLP